MKTWIAKLRSQFEDEADWTIESDAHGLAEKLGFKSAAQAWEANPLVGGEVNPADFGQVTLDAFTTGYVHCALWSSLDGGGDPLDSTKSMADIAPETMARMVADCEKFQAENGEDLKAFTRDDAQNGHDFWLARCGHGAGFWDHHSRSQPEFYEIGERLSDAARAFKNCEFYIGDDGRVHI